MATRQIKGHPPREERRERAAERLAAGTPHERTKAHRLGRCGEEHPEESATPTVRKRVRSKKV